MKLYIAGPMRGYKSYNFPAFHAAAANLRHQGHHVFSPAEKDLDMGFDPNLSLEEQDFDIAAVLLDDLKEVSKCDALYLLDKWEESTGASAEYYFARALGKRVYFQGLLEP